MSDPEFIKIKNALAFQRNLHCVGDKPIGKGAYGQVLKAKCSEEGKSYAIKILPLQEEERAKYQKRELEALMTLNLSKESKQNVIEYFKSWILQASDVKQLCIQMELCSVDLCSFIYRNDMGGPEIIKAQGSPRFYRQVFEQILNGLVAIHSIRWVHRDIHPGNILVVNQNPKQISDIHIKIADFGLARHIQIETFTTVGLTIVPKLEKVSCFSRHASFRAPELLTDTYDFKVDVYSAGMVLYFISRFLADNEKWCEELTDLKKKKFEVEERLFHKDDEKLSDLIKNLIQDDPNVRLSALKAKEFMFPTQPVPNESTDATKPTAVSRKKAVSFIAKDNQEKSHLCRLNEFTLTALKANIQDRVHVTVDRQILRHEVMIHGCEKIYNEVEDDTDVDNIFTDALEKNTYAVIIVTERDEDDITIEAEQFSSGDVSMDSSSL